MNHVPATPDLDSPFPVLPRRAALRPRLPVSLGQSQRATTWSDFRVGKLPAGLGALLNLGLLLAPVVIPLPRKGLSSFIFPMVL